MKNWLKYISSLAIIVMIAVTAILYICPMSFAGTMDMVKAASMCDSVGVASSQAGCADSHLNVITQLLSNVPQTMNSLLILLFLAVTYRALSHKYLLTIVGSFFTRSKHFYLYYQTSIKFLIEQRLLKYLSLLGNYTVVSFS